MTLSQLLSVVRSRCRIVFASVAVFTLLALILCLAMPKRFTATGHVVIDLLSQDIIGGSSASLSANSSASYMPTQLAIISSPRVAEQVVRKLHFDQDLDRHQAWRSASGGKGDEIAWHAHDLLKHLQVKATLDSNIVAISFTSNEAAMSAAVANAFTSSYIETAIALRDEPAKGMSEWLRDRVEDARFELDRAQQHVTQYQRGHSIGTSDDRYDAGTQRLAMLSQQLVSVQAQTAEAKSKLAGMTADGAARDVAQDANVLRLKTDLSELQQKLSESAALFGKNYPATVQMRARIEATQTQLEEETSRVKASLASDVAASEMKEAVFVNATAVQKERLTELMAQRAVFDQLSKDRDAAQSVYQEINQKYIQTRLLAHSVQTNISVLSPAAEPLLPSAPRPLLYGPAAALAGVLLGIALAFLCELKDRKVRSEAELEMVLRAAVLGRKPAQQSLMSKLATWSSV